MPNSNKEYLIDVIFPDLDIGLFEKPRPNVKIEAYDNNIIESKPIGEIEVKSFNQSISIGSGFRNNYLTDT